MEVRITYRVESTFEGEDMAEIRKQWYEEKLPDGMEFVELVSAQDVDNDYEDVMDEM